MTPNKLSEFLQEYIGCKYTWWHEGQEVGSESPFYSREANNFPTVEEVREKGINCAGLLNLGRAFCGLPGFGGTYQVEPMFDWHELKEDTKIVEGMVLFRKYADDEDQGHIGYAISDTEFIHSCDYHGSEEHSSASENVIENREGSNRVENSKDFDEVETGVVVSPIKPWCKYMTHWATFEEFFSKN